MIPSPAVIPAGLTVRADRRAIPGDVSRRVWRYQLDGFGGTSSMGVTITNDSMEEYEFSKGAPAPMAAPAGGSGSGLPI